MMDTSIRQDVILSLHKVLFLQRHVIIILLGQQNLSFKERLNILCPYLGGYLMGGLEIKMAINTHLV